MQLKKIELQGFKSFAGKTEIDFLDGITTIVGPNGSGKSNIADAVRWVLGEQSAKILRGSKMEDIIFSGTESRKKVGFAEVSLYLDNSDCSLPVEYSEVVVTRRVFRTGESNYLINSNECRLKDVQEIFMDTGVGKDGYSIIGQGKIDEILSNKSEERRAIFEEASGIMKYKTRKEEASKKLISADNNLSRVNDILNEIENTILPLEEKSIKAKKYLKLRDNLKELDVNIFLTSIKENASNLAELDSKIEILLNDINLEEKDAIELEKAKLNIKDRLEEINFKIEEAQAKYFEIENNSEKLNSKVDLDKLSIQNGSENISRLEIEISEELNKISILNDEIKIKIEKKESLNLNKVRFENELKEKENSLFDILKTLDEKGEHIEKIKLKSQELEEELNNCNLEISSSSATIDSNKKQILNVEKSSTNHIFEKDRLVMDQDDITSILNKNVSKFNKNDEEMNLNNINLENENKLLNEITVKKNKLNEELMSVKSKYSYLTNLKNENEGYFKSVKSVLDYVKENSIKNVYCTVATAISTDEKFEKAIEVALGNYLQNIIVDSPEDAKGLIEYLKTNSYGRATFLPLTSMRKVDNEDVSKYKQYNGFIGSATSLLKFDKKFENVINHALDKCIIVSDLDSANYIYSKAKGQIRIVTLDGELISSSGSITGGQTSNRTSGLIGRDEKIKSLEKLTNEKELEKEKLDSESLEIISKLKIVEETLNNLKFSRDLLSIEVATYTEKLENIKKEISKSEENNFKSEEVKHTLLNENESLVKHIYQINKNISDINNEITNLNSEIEEYTRFNKAKEQTINFLNEDIVNLKISLSSFDESSISIDEMKAKLEMDIKNFEEGINKRNKQKEEYLLDIINFQNDIDNTSKEVEALIKFKQDYLDISEKLRIDRKDCINKQDILELKMLQSINKIVKIKEEKSKVENRKIKFDIEIDNLKNKMWDDYEFTISSAKEYYNSIPIIEDTSNLYKDAEKIRNEIKNLGDVDVSSIDEYNTTRARFDFITVQKNDLDETKQKLENLISNMTTLMRSQFSKQFKIINENFSKTFSELFGGGKASLSLTDESNILESGIEIEVQPPGKKLQSMMLLSGGERALTATALLFAIIKIKAPPFCILDEIEAALDDINVHRFAEYIKKYSKDTQFIVITHRKGTMEVAKTIYGITMEEYGISKVISMEMK
ncbi:MAG: chromosome segregation protein SMC [Clostridia bacterium]|nr:chromosome segregation protein SMC [Clostridia bacterium]MDD4387125.1 chromosome segregation protein SMC [Clostridia bacterium]